MKKHVRIAGQSLWIIFLMFCLLFFYCEEIKHITQEVLRINKEQEPKKIALTFDDGPHPIYTPKLLEGLRQREVTVTFFVTGDHAATYPELIKKMKEDGHMIGNHTYHHVQLSSVGAEVFMKELQETNQVLEEILGEEVVFVRPPFGDWEKAIEKKINLLPVLWDIDPLDWCTENAEKIVKRVLDNAEDGSIILMHDEYAASVEAALKIVDELKKEGYEFVTVEEILLN